MLPRDFHQRMGHRAGRHVQLPDESIVGGYPAAHRVDQLTKLARPGAGATHPIVQPGVLSLSVGDRRLQLAPVGLLGAEGSRRATMPATRPTTIIQSIRTPFS